jgi:hypothetical protein
MIGDLANPPTTPYPITVSASGTVDHGVWIPWARGSRTGMTLDLIQNTPPFSMDFYRQFVRDMYDKDDGAPFAIQRWTTNPNFYVRTVDENGRPVEPEVLARILPAITDGVQAFTGGLYHASIITGTDVRPAEQDWINVNIIRDPREQSTCGNSYVGLNPGTINLWEDVCSCGSNKIPGSVAMHEVGHAMGFWHVSDPQSLMYPYDSGDCRNGTLSAAESFDARIAYARPNGNTDPDQDPSGAPTPAGGRRRILVKN